MRIAVVSDTHSLLRPEVLPAIAGAEHILHAGDVEDISILDALRAIAPVTAVRGNVDTDGPCADLPATEVIEFEGASVYMLHNIADLDLDPVTAGIRVIIYGHSHKAAIEKRGGILHLNPGSIGPRRFGLPVTFAWLTLSDADPQAEIVTLPD